MKHRSELLQVYSKFAKMVETQFSKHIKIFRFDNAFEYINILSKLFCIPMPCYQLTCPDTSHQNGRVERTLHHIRDIVRALLLFTKVPAPFWGEAALHAVCAINHIPSPVIQNQTPYECLFGSPPDYHHLHSFSSAYFVLL